MYKHRFKALAAVSAVVLLFFLAPVQGYENKSHGSDPELNRAQLIAHMLRQQLPRHHYSHKEINDDLSQDSYDLFIKKLDPQKRFLLARDVEKLSAYSRKIDDEINLGQIDLPAVAAAIFKERIPQIQKMVRELIGSINDFSRDESLETDPKNFGFCETEAELKDRWRKVLKYQIITRYLNLEQDESGKGKSDRNGKKKNNGKDNGPEVKEDVKKPSAPKDLKARAREKVQKSMDDVFTKMIQETERDYYDRYFDSIANAFDPHTTYMPPASKEDFDISMRGSLEGIGALLRQEDGYIKVVRVIPGSAAARQGELQAEDTILEVAQGTDGEPVDITDMKLRDAVSMIRGEKGTTVRITIRKPDGTRKVLALVRDTVQLEATFVKGTDIEVGDPPFNVGYLKIPAFYRDFEKTKHGGEGRNSTDDVRKEVERLSEKGIRGLIVDLRNNGGGALTDAVSIAGLFIDSGPVVQVKSSSREMKVLHDTDSGIAFKGPMIVLVNEFSASASEILAAALQDYGRAVIVGSPHTHGKGTVQSLFDLDKTMSLKNMDSYKPLGTMKVTIQKFYRVSGESTQSKGVVPDIVLPDRFQYLKTGEKYLDYSLPWDLSEATPFEKWTPKSLPVAALQKKSLERTKGDPEFKKIADEAERSKVLRDTTIQTIQIDKIRKEREEAKKGMDMPGMEGHGDDESGDNDAGEGPEIDKEKRLRTELGKDVYVRESSKILTDLIGEMASAANLRH